MGGVQRRNSFSSRKVWKSMQTLRDYCGEVIFILNQCKNRMKNIYEQFYISKTFEAILLEDFAYKGILKVTLSDIVRRPRII